MADIIIKDMALTEKGLECLEAAGCAIACRVIDVGLEYTPQGYPIYDVTFPQGARRSSGRISWSALGEVWQATIIEGSNLGCLIPARLQGLAIIE